jgi:hypothetical protein
MCKAGRCSTWKVGVNEAAKGHATNRWEEPALKTEDAGELLVRGISITV